MLNYIWLIMILIGVFVAGLLGRISGDHSIAESAFGAAKSGITLAFGLIGGMMLWLGILRLADKAGFIKIIARAIRPIMTRLFPDVPAEHPAMGAMIMNMAANMLGLGNAATPLGLKAMQELETLNPHKGTATNAMCTFLAINTSSVTLIPATAIIYVTAAGIKDPFSIVVPAILATLCSTIVAITAVKLLQNLPIFRAKAGADVASEEESAESNDEAEAEAKPISPRGWIFLTIVGLMMLTVCVFEFVPEIRESFLKKSGLEQVLVAEGEAKEAANELKKEKSKLEQAAKGERQEGWRGILNSFASLIIPLIFVIFTAGALVKGIRIFEEFVEGAKEGWNVAIRIMPFLVGIMVGMVILRDSGTLLLLKSVLSPVLSALNFHPDLLPMALMRPLSGGGSSGVLAEILSNESTPLMVKYTAATMYGSTETTFYVLAVYFGSVAVRRTRHALVAGLCADAAGVVAAITICRLMFG